MYDSLSSKCREQHRWGPRLRLVRVDEINIPHDTLMHNAPAGFEGGIETGGSKPLRAPSSIALTSTPFKNRVWLRAKGIQQ